MRVRPYNAMMIEGTFRQAGEILEIEDPAIGAHLVSRGLALAVPTDQEDAPPPPAAAPHVDEEDGA